MKLLILALSLFASTTVFAQSDRNHGAPLVLANAEEAERLGSFISKANYGPSVSFQYLGSTKMGTSLDRILMWSNGIATLKTPLSRSTKEIYGVSKRNHAFRPVDSSGEYGAIVSCSIGVFENRNALLVGRSESQIQFASNDLPEHEPVFYGSCVEYVDSPSIVSGDFAGMIAGPVSALKGH